MSRRTRTGRTPGSAGISRRDFLNGALIAAGTAAFSSTPLRALAGTSDSCDGGIGTDPRVLRGGNIPSVFNVAHWLRDRRLTFSASSVTLAASNCDTDAGTFPIYEDNGKYDVIIVGGGISGLSAAFYIRNRNKRARILILDGNKMFGGNASRDDADGIADISTAAGAYAVVPYADFQTEIYTGTGIDWNANLVDGPFYNYFFDGQTPYALPGARGWNIDTYGAGTATMPYPPEIIKDLLSAKADFINWASTTGAPTDPADNGDPQFDYLSLMSLADYFKSKGFSPAVADFYTRYAVDALSGTSDQVNAYSSISFIGAEYGPLFTFPGGTSGIARHIARRLVPDAFPRGERELIELRNEDIDLDDLDDRENAVRIRQNAMALRGDQDSQSASVIYFSRGRFHRATAKAAIFAGQGHTAATCLSSQMSGAQIGAFFSGFTLAPVVVANVSLRHAAPLVDLGLGYDQYWWGSQYWADFTIADWWDRKRRNQRHRPVTLNLFGGNSVPASGMHNERLKLLSTPFSSYESSLRDDLNRVLAAGGFDFDRDVTSVYLYRWGHSQVFPVPGFPFGTTQVNGQLDRDQSKRHIFRKQIGRFSIAGQDSESTPAVESALGSGLRTALEVLPLL